MIPDIKRIRERSTRGGLPDIWADEVKVMCDEIERLRKILDKLLYDAQGNGFIGDNLDDAIAWATRQMGEACRLRAENDLNHRKRFVLDGVLVEEVPCDTLPKRNMCFYCVLRGTACYERRDVSCHADSRPDGRDVVFRQVKK